MTTNFSGGKEKSSLVAVHSLNSPWITLYISQSNTETNYDRRCCLNSIYLHWNLKVIHPSIHPSMQAEQGRPDILPSWRSRSSPDGTCHPLYSHPSPRPAGPAQESYNGRHSYRAPKAPRLFLSTWKSEHCSLSSFLMSERWDLWGWAQPPCEVNNSLKLILAACNPIL